MGSRLWAVSRGDNGPEVRFGFPVRNDNRERTPPLVRVKAVCAPGNRGASGSLPSCSRTRTDPAVPVGHPRTLAASPGQLEKCARGSGRKRS
jgi:hypothetical protein